MSGRAAPARRPGPGERDPSPARASQTTARLGAIAAWSGLAFVVAYAVLRLAAAAFYPEPNPAIIVSQESVAYFQRLAVSGYVAGMVALALWSVPAERVSLDRSLPTAVWVAFAAIVLQAVVVP